MSPLLSKVYMYAVTKEVKMGMGRSLVRFLEEGREWRLLGLLYAGNLVLCGESEEGLRAVLEQFVELCRRRGLKANADKSKVMVMNEEEGLECEVYVDRIRLEDVSEFKYLGCVLDESGREGVDCSRKRGRGRRVAGAVRSLLIVRDLQLECAKVLHETLLIPVLIYGSEAMLRKEKERSKISTVQIDRGVLCIRRMDRIKELCGMTKRFTKGLMKVFSGGSAIWRGWRMIGLLRESM